MKLKKREITLNEVDSLKDVFFLEEKIESRYGEVENYAFKKETVNEIDGLRKESEKDKEFVLGLWKKSKARQL